MLPNLGPAEMIIVMGLAVLLFGKRLPEVGRSLGKGIVEFKKGLSDVTSGLDDASISGYSSPYQSAPKQYDAPPRGADLRRTPLPSSRSPARRRPPPRPARSSTSRRRRADHSA